MRSMFVLCFVAMASPLTVAAGPAALQNGADAERLYELAIRERQYRHLLSIPGADIEYASFGRLRMLKGPTGILLPDASHSSAGDVAAGLIQKLQPLLMASGTETLSVRAAQSREWFGGGRDVFMDQYISGIRVIDGGVNVRTDKSGEIVFVSSLFVPAKGVSAQPKLTHSAARERLEQFLVANELAAPSSIEFAKQQVLGFWTDNGQADVPRLVWLIDASYTTPRGSREYVRYGIDAFDGEVRHASREVFGLTRTTYTLHGLTDAQFAINNGGSLLLWNEGAVPSNPDSHGLSAYNSVPRARNAWANFGMHYENVKLHVHWGAPTNANAQYLHGADGATGHLVFGDPMATEPDAVAHEYGHGVYRRLYSSVPVLFWNEWHSVNEFYADFTSVIAELNQVVGPFPEVWRITSQVLRDWAYPTASYVLRPQDGYLDWYGNVRRCCDTSAIAYSNSTIFGHAVYLMRAGGYHSRAGASAVNGPIPFINVQPINDNQLVHAIFAYALNELTFTQASSIDALKLKAATVSAANTLAGPAVASTVANAWTAVGVGYNCSAPPLVPDMVVTPWYCKGRHDVTWTQSPGVKYHGMVALPGGTWDLVGQTTLDAATNSCTQNVPSTRKFRMRACNACGCSAWTHDEYMYYWSPCQ